MLRKAQAEFAIILGLLIIAIVVAIYAYSAVTPPSLKPVALTEEQKAVASYVGDLIRGAATHTLSEMYRNGGYLDASVPPLGHVSHMGLGKKIPLWQICGEYAIPDFESEFLIGVRDYILLHLPDSQVIEGSTATFGKYALLTNAKFYDNKVTLTVNLPTTVGGQTVPQPYAVDISTKMGRIYDFAKNFARMQADCRVLDNNLLMSLMQSNENSRPCWIPTLGNAKRAHTFTWKNLRDCMERHIKYSLSNTLLGKEVPVRDDGKIPDWAIEFFPVPAVIDYTYVPDGASVCGGFATANSKNYNDLHVQFYYGDDDGLDRTEFSAPEHLKIMPKVGGWMRFMGGIKVAEYAQKYNVKYPVIVNVWDSSMRKSFKFALLVYIQDNAIGDCTADPLLPVVGQSQSSATYDEVCVREATADARITVKYKTADEQGSDDVIGATVYFYECELGTTGAGEAIVTKVPKLWGALTVRDGQREYTECHSYTALDNIMVTIPRSKRFTFNFYTVSVSKTDSTYRIDSMSPANERIDVVMTRGGDVCQPPEPEGVVNMNQEGAIVSQLDVTNMPVDEYSVGVSTSSAMMSQEGFTPAGSDLYVYAPIEAVSGSLLEGSDLSGLYEKCGLDLISNVKYNGTVISGCLWTATE